MGLISSVLKILKSEPPSTAGSTKSRDHIKVKVRRISDGDTFMAVGPSGEFCVRLSAIDCPEDGQPWSDAAKAGLIKMIGGREVYLETFGQDKYRRTIATVFVDQGSERINVNERMVSLGHAWVMRQFYDHLPKDQRFEMNKREEWAKSNRVGLWKNANPIPPWLWRKAALKPREKDFWNKYLSTLPNPDQLINARVTASCVGNPEITDELLSLYLNGKKTAGSSLLEDFHTSGDPLPQVGNYWICLDRDENPRCILKTFRVVMQKYKDVPAEIAEAEGEGDRSLAYWRRVHKEFFVPYLAKWGVNDLEEATVVTEFFTVVYR